MHSNNFLQFEIDTIILIDDELTWKLKYIWFTFIIIMKEKLILLQKEIDPFAVIYSNQNMNNVWWLENIFANYIILFQAVKHLHDNDLVHMDIKPENIFISNDVCKLGDFGLVLDIATQVKKSLICWFFWCEQLMLELLLALFLIHG